MWRPVFRFLYVVRGLLLQAGQGPVSSMRGRAAWGRVGKPSHKDMGSGSSLLTLQVTFPLGLVCEILV